MAELLYFTGPMDSGKSTLALQIDHTYTAGGRRGRLFTSQDRAGRATISSRLGLIRPAIEAGIGFDFLVYVTEELTAGERVDYLVCDEAQFYSAEQIDQLARVVDDLSIDVFAVGILTDFRTRLFPGSRRLVELADRVETLQVPALCWCGARGTHNARTVGGRMVWSGDQVALGDVRALGEDGFARLDHDDLVPDAGLDGLEDESGSGQDVSPRATGAIAYEVLCRKHHRQGLTRRVAQAATAEPLPFDRDRDVPS